MRWLRRYFRSAGQILINIWESNGSWFKTKKFGWYQQQRDNKIHYSRRRQRPMVHTCVKNKHPIFNLLYSTYNSRRLNVGIRLNAQIKRISQVQSALPFATQISLLQSFNQLGSRKFTKIYCLYKFRSRSISTAKIP